MTTTPVHPAASSPAGQTPATAPGAGFHFPSYLLGLTTALILLGAAILLWPRSQPAPIQLQAPPTLAPTPAAPPTAAVESAPTPSPLVIFVSGAVGQPGLYTLAPTARIGDAIAAAGGLLPGVDPALINQAQPLVDGAQLHIPAPLPTLPAAAQTPDEPQVAAAPAAETDAETDADAAAPASAPTAAPALGQPPAGLSVAQPPALPTPTTASAAAPAAAPAAASAAAPAPVVADRAATLALPAAGTLINVNTATSAELESLPAIGPAKAQAIIDNRPYAVVDELDRVPGIGPATLEQIRPLVTTQ